MDWDWGFEPREAFAPPDSLTAGAFSVVCTPRSSSFSIRSLAIFNSRSSFGALFAPS